MTNVQQIKSAREFAARWQGKGYEKGESQIFWVELLTQVFDIQNPSEFLHFEQQVHLDHTSFIDAYIPRTHVMIEQKSIEKDLGAPIRQSDGTLLNPFQQAKRYAAELPYSQRPRWIVTCNFREFWVYDMEQPNGEPQKILLANLGEEYYRLQFLVDEGNEHLKREMEVSVKAGELVGVIYDKLLEQYEVVESQKSKVESEINSSALQQGHQINSPTLQQGSQINSSASQHSHQINSPALQQGSQINSPAPLAGRGLGGGANTEDILRSLNILCVRLVFCLYAEDAGLFHSRTAFHDYLAQFPAKHIRKALIDLFEVLDTPLDERDPYLDEDLAAFPYVNGGLFGKIGNGELSGLSEGNNSPNSLNSQFKLIIPQFNDDLKNLLLEKASADFDWSEISPTIFGAVFESTLNPETRRSGGMHYTSIENIHKVIDPLFLNDLRAEFYAIIGNENSHRLNRSLQIQQMRNESHKSVSSVKSAGNFITPAKRQALANFQNKLASLTFFDPACGSGNFLTETFLSLRRLENEVIQAMYGGANILTFDTLIKVNISQFYGIEINDFACTVAKTALWIAEHQMMQQTSMIAGKPIDFLPLKTNAYIHEGNALRTDWASLFVGAQAARLPNISSSIAPELNSGNAAEGTHQPILADITFPDYIIGNPPFVGYTLQSKEQKADLAAIMKGFGSNIDYVAAWYKKSVELMQLALPQKHIRAALVSTNSITQGEQVAAIWKPLMEQYGLQIDFAYRTFRWDSEADIKAHVHCVIIGFSIDQNRSFRVDTNQLPRPACGEGAGGGENTAERRKINLGNNTLPRPLTPSPQAGWGSEITLDYTTSNRASLDYRDTIGIPKEYKKHIFLSDSQTIEANNINGYLLDAPNIFIESRKKPLCDVPEMLKGSQPTDGGNFFFTREEKDEICNKYPQITQYIKRFYGATEFINNKERYCLWLRGVAPSVLRSCPEVMQRIEAVKQMRLESPKVATQKWADFPTLFTEDRQPDSDYILIPSVSSERRRYIPIGFISADEICGNANLMLPNADFYLFGILMSNVHNAWMRVVCGRLEMRYRYSNTIVYNNFPFPTPTEQQKAKIEQTAQAILDARQKYSDCSLAELYDELTMPPELRRAHQENDKAVMAAYGFKIGMTESDCVAELFKLYQQLTK